MIRPNITTPRAAKPSATVFLNRCQEAFARLAEFPKSGTHVRYRHPLLEGCRFILVPEFDKILVFYRIAGGQLEIVRILHGARDIEAAFGDKRDQTPPTSNLL